MPHNQQPGPKSHCDPERVEYSHGETGHCGELPEPRSAVRKPRLPRTARPRRQRRSRGSAGVYGWAGPCRAVRHVRRLHLQITRKCWNRAEELRGTLPWHPVLHPVHLAVFYPTSPDTRMFVFVFMTRKNPASTYLKVSELVIRFSVSPPQKVLL